MTKPRDRAEKILRECSEPGVAEGADLWPRIRQSALDRRQRSRRVAGRLPSGPAGWALVALFAMLFSTGAYVGSGLLYDTFMGELPGGEGPVFGEQLQMSKEQAASGAQVSVDWAYADAKTVVIGFKVVDMDEERRVSGNPAELETLFLAEENLISEQSVDTRYPNRIELTSEDDTDFDAIGGQTYDTGGSDPLAQVPNTVVFQPEKSIEPGMHNFRLKIPIMERATDADGEESEPRLVGEPFVFSFDIPVRPAPTIEVDKEVERSGVAITLDRAVDSPGAPYAVACFEAPDEEHVWSPTFSSGTDQIIEVRPLDDNCFAASLPEQIDGHTSLKVTQISGYPRDSATHDASAHTHDASAHAASEHEDTSGHSDPSGMDEEIIEGPWNLDFEVPSQ